MEFQHFVEWIKEYVGCEVYFIPDPKVVNGFAQYQNHGHVIYLLGDEGDQENPIYIDILAHEAGHVIYNQRKLAEGKNYEELVRKTEMKLQGIHTMLKNGIISNAEYERFYAAIEEEWESDQEKHRILYEWDQLVGYRSKELNRE